MNSVLIEMRRNYVVSAGPWFHWQNYETHGETARLDRYETFI